MSSENPFTALFRYLLRPQLIIPYMILCVGAYFYLDILIATYFHNVLPMPPYGLKLFSGFGLSIVYFLLFFIAALYFTYVGKNSLWASRFWFLWCALLLSETICLFLKVICGRARPPLWFSEHLWGFYGFKLHSIFWSFPSGHTTAIMAVTGGLGIVFPRFFYPLLLLGLSVAFSRVVLIQHYFSDVLIAIYLTFLELGLLLWIFRHLNSKGLVWQDDATLMDKEAS